MTKRSRKRERRRLPEGLHIDVSGDRILLGRTMRPGEVPTTGAKWADVGSSNFDGRCPLCGKQTPSSELTAEHVPPFATGGFKRTWTCEPCNGRASGAEADLLRWWASDYRAKASATGIPGNRAVGSALLRRSASGRPALIMSGEPVSHMIDSAAGVGGTLRLTISGPTGEWPAALFKSAYLAACLHLGEIPTTPDGKWARWAIRNGGINVNDMLGVGPDAVPFRVFRLAGFDAAALWVGHAVMPWHLGGDVPIFGVGLGDVAFVTWPIPDLRERAIARAEG